MRNTIAVMNTKGGVGKSTIVLALAETLSTHHGKNVLVIDSDAQASVSSMLMSTMSLRKLQGDGRTLVDYLVSVVLRDTPIEWTDFVVGGVSDIDDARSVYLMPSDMQLTLFEREVSREARHGPLRISINALLSRARIVFDIVLIDCPPGLSVLTESWLREADFHLSPTKPDYISVCGLDVFSRFKQLNPEMGFAENVGVLINMMDRQSPEDTEYRRWLASNPDNRCFSEAVPRFNSLQSAARFQSDERSFGAKYPGEIGATLRLIAAELLGRLAAAAEVAVRPATVSPVQPPAPPPPRDIAPEPVPAPPVASPVVPEPGAVGAAHVVVSPPPAPAKV